MSQVTISLVRHADAELSAAFARLLPQLSRSALALSQAQLQEIVSAPGNDVFIARARNGNAIVGALTLVHFRIPTGVRAWIEDVVVDEAARGLGAGAALVEAAVARAQELKVRTLDLTSNPARVAAHRLYEKCGFAVRDTSVYRYEGN